MISYNYAFMKITTFLFLLAMAILPAHAQTNPADREKRAEIERKIQQGEPITPEERKFLEQILQQRNVDWTKTHPPHESLGFIPLNDLGEGTYKGQHGGLYPGGSNQPPAAHKNAGIKIARGIQPINGKIVMISTGMSNTHVEGEVFAKLLASASGINPRLQFVNCAQSGGSGKTTADPNHNYWRVAEKTLASAGVTPGEVQIAWIKQTVGDPQGDFPADAKKLQEYLLATVQNLHDKYPNLKIAYLTTRIYAGYAKSPLSPEPYAYEDGFGVKWLIADQIAGKPELNYDPAKGPVKSPWLAWGPYLWADGVKPRGDGLTWTADDFIPGDRTHPSDAGREKVAEHIINFLRGDPTSAPWFLEK